MHVLGISCFYHDSAAALLRDGEVVFAAAEERYTRRKHCTDFPLHAIQAALGHEGITIADVEAVAFYEKPILKFDRLMLSSIATWPLGFPIFRRFVPLWFKQKLQTPAIFRRELGFTKPVYYVEHHLAHAASSFLVSPYDEAAIITVDGTGEWSTTTIGVGRGTKIALDHEIRFPHSLGLLYSAITLHLGFQVNNCEGKIMGLASYGDPEPYRAAFEQLIAVRDDGSFHMNMDYFGYLHRPAMTSSRLDGLLGPPRKGGEALDQRHMDIAAALQATLEDALIKMGRHVHETTGQSKLCLAGGVALNCVANGRVLRETPFDDLYIQPAAGDDGTAIGCAAYLYHTLMGNPRVGPLRAAYLGDGFTDDDVHACLDARGVAYRRMERDELLRWTARQIADNRIVGWFQGRMEFGPRALGNRSILANPCSPDMKDILNHRVKHREPFRPFAPSALVDRAAEIFDLGVPSPFMLLVADVHPDKRDAVPAITHVDGTARLQTVARDDNPLYYGLIAELAKLTGVPVVLNTSFNVRGEPIIRTPDDAYACFEGTGIDTLVMHDCVVEKPTEGA
ncbi:MAG: carbamoyltransferase [Candidatus Brocadiae bacterium]|nr:carbamoyltransferase [Candidatus Brocadiia bacterium]